MSSSPPRDHVEALLSRLEESLRPVAQSNAHHEQFSELLADLRRQMESCPFEEHAHLDDLLAEQNERLAALVEATFEGVVISRDGRVVEANAQFARLFGYEPHEVAGRPVAAFAMPEDRDRVRELNLSGYELPYTVTARHRDGSPLYIEVRGRPFQYRGQQARVTSVRDLSRARTWQRLLEERNRELERRNEALREFTFAASHDLKEPLRGITNHVAFLLEDFGECLGEEGRERLERVAHLARRTHLLSERLLQYARLDHEAPQRVPTDLDPLLADALDSLRSLVEARGARITRTGPLPRVSCDPVGIRQVFQNLLSNAIKYSDDPAPQVEVGTCPGPGGEPAVFVRDHGIGIDPEHHERIFQMFRRLHPREAYGGGTGAGLALTRKIIELHRGRLWLESEPGQGSTFFFHLGSEDQEGPPPTHEVPP